MKTLLLCAAAIFTMSLSACAVHTPEGSIVIDPDSPYYGHPGGFCPPGQAKKDVVRSTL
ncbi:YgdI/YgdR family lipoprotein [Acinetobacter baumannii]